MPKFSVSCSFRVLYSLPPILFLLSSSSSSALVACARGVAQRNEGPSGGTDETYYVWTVLSQIRRNVDCLLGDKEHLFQKKTGEFRTERCVRVRVNSVSDVLFANPRSVIVTHTYIHTLLRFHCCVYH